MKGNKGGGKKGLLPVSSTLLYPFPLTPSLFLSLSRLSARLMEGPEREAR